MTQFIQIALIYAGIVVFAFTLRGLYNWITKGAHPYTFYSKLRPVFSVLPWIIAIVSAVSFTVGSARWLGVSSELLGGLTLQYCLGFTGLAALILSLLFLASTLFSSYCKGRIASRFQHRYWVLVFAALAFLFKITMIVVVGAISLFLFLLRNANRDKSDSDIVHDPFGRKVAGNGYHGYGYRKKQNTGRYY